MARADFSVLDDPFGKAYRAKQQEFRAEDEYRAKQDEARQAKETDAALRKSVLDQIPSDEPSQPVPEGGTPPVPVARPNPNVGMIRSLANFPGQGKAALDLYSSGVDRQRTLEDDASKRERAIQDQLSTRRWDIAKQMLKSGDASMIAQLAQEEGTQIPQQWVADVASRQRLAQGLKVVQDLYNDDRQAGGRFLAEFMHSGDYQGALQRNPPQAKPKTQTPRNYITPDKRQGVTLDGLTDAATGAPLPQGLQVTTAQVQVDGPGGVFTTTTQSALQEADRSQRRFLALLGETRKLSQDPNNFGLPGYAKGVLQDANALAGGMARLLGKNSLSDAMVDVQADLLQQPGVSAALALEFDPTLPALQSIANLLAYQAAGALAEQTGRGLSDKDITLFRQIVGNPTDWMMSQDKFLAKLDLLERIAMAQREADTGFRSGGDMPPPPAPGGATGTAEVMPQGGLQVGDVDGGYRYVGGDPSREESWEPVE
ncbi:MAG: hypothetical protein VYB54_15740 [Pseudomonadota bacterium]|nr:hypothetical protein [Pseudomonadota bacterium]